MKRSCIFASSAKSVGHRECETLLRSTTRTHNSWQTSLLEQLRFRRRRRRKTKGFHQTETSHETRSSRLVRNPFREEHLLQMDRRRRQCSQEPLSISDLEKCCASLIGKQILEVVETLHKGETHDSTKAAELKLGAKPKVVQLKPHAPVAVPSPPKSFNALGRRLWSEIWEAGRTAYQQTDAHMS